MHLFNCFIQASINFRNSTVFNENPQHFGDRSESNINSQRNLSQFCWIVIFNELFQTKTTKIRAKLKFLKLLIQVFSTEPILPAYLGINEEKNLSTI